MVPPKLTKCYYCTQHATCTEALINELELYKLVGGCIYLDLAGSFFSVGKFVFNICTMLATLTCIDGYIANAMPAIWKWKWNFKQAQGFFSFFFLSSDAVFDPGYWGVATPPPPPPPPLQKKNIFF